MICQRCGEIRDAADYRRGNLWTCGPCAHKLDAKNNVRRLWAAMTAR